MVNNSRLKVFDKLRIRIEGFGSFGYFINNGHVIRANRMQTLIMKCFQQSTPVKDVINAVCLVTGFNSKSVLDEIYQLLKVKALCFAHSECDGSYPVASTTDNLIKQIRQTCSLLSERASFSFPIAPLWVHIQPSIRCNLNCIHCYCNAGKREDVLIQKTSKWLELIETISRMEIFEVIFSGGELLLNNEFMKMASLALKLGMRVKSGTNGTTITRKKAEILLKTGIRKIQVSLDGADSVTHDSIRGAVGSFEKTIEGIRILRQSGIEVVLNTVIQKLNYSDIEGIIDIGRKLGCQQFEFVHLFPSGRAIEVFEKQSLSYIERATINSILRRIAEKNKDATIVFGHNCSDVQHNRINEHCAAGNTGVCIDQKGDVFPCIMGISQPQVLCGNVFKEGLDSIWKSSDILNKFRTPRSAKSASDCCGCVWIVECRGFCPIIAGGLAKNKSDLCKGFIA